MPQIVPIQYRDAVSAALDDAHEAETRWSDARHSSNSVAAWSRRRSLRYLLYPLHAVIFSDLARAIARDAVKREHDA
jgi:hypothetical protein